MRRKAKGRQPDLLSYSEPGRVPVHLVTVGKCAGSMARAYMAKKLRMNGRRGGVPFRVVQTIMAYHFLLAWVPISDWDLGIKKNIHNSSNTQLHMIYAMSNLGIMFKGFWPILAKRLWQHSCCLLAAP